MKIRITMPLMAAAVVLLLIQATAVAMIVPANPNAHDAPAPGKSPAIGEGWNLERVDFIHYAKPANPGPGRKGDSCSKLMGYKWRALPVSYVINTENDQGLSGEIVAAEISAAAETWDSATSSEVFSDSYSVDPAVSYGKQDFRNAIEFGVYPDPNAIAVTSVWYTPKGKQIVEFDMIFNTMFAWGNADVDPLKMDLPNIATHEMGHAVGLADVYSSACAEVTEYGYSAAGETKKRSLESSDISGIISLYGS